MTSPLPTDEDREALIRVIEDDANYIFTGSHDELVASVAADAILAAGFRRSVVSTPSDENEPIYVAEARNLERANALLAKIVAVANISAIEGADGFVESYSLPVGPIHKAIPYLATQGIVATSDGQIWSSVSMEERFDVIAACFPVSAVSAPPTITDDEAIAIAFAKSDDMNHEDLCHCRQWPESCVTYGERRPWTHNAEFVARAALRAALGGEA